MIYRLRFTRNAIKDIQRHKKSGDKKLLRKIEFSLEELREQPRTGTSQPEQLKNDLQGLYSRRITKT
jgi:toxin YoeB